MTYLYKAGVGTMLLSFPASFYFSRQIAQDPTNAMKHLKNNVGISTVAVLIFCYTLYKRGQVEEKLANKYLFGTFNA